MSRPLVIIDGSNLARRAYHAGSSMGVLSAARKVLVGHENAEVVAAWDGPPPTWRHRLWPQYKAHRERDPEALRAVRQDFKAARAEGIVGIMARNGEADDAAATLARRALQKGRRVILVTADKDWGQLMGVGVLWFAPEAGGQLVARSPDWFLDRYGIYPYEWPDYVGLVGDGTDGIPGVRGIGPVKAGALLERHMDLDGVIASGELKPDQVEMATVSRKLATLDAQSFIEWR